MVRYLVIAIAALALLGSCDLISGKKEVDPASEAAKKLKLLQIAVESAVPEGSKGTTTASVLAVVDSSIMGQAAPDAKDEEAKAKYDEAQRRERVVRQELNNVLVNNTLIDVVQPGQAEIDKARAEIAANNSSALSIALALELGTALKADYLICALIDEDGKMVNIDAQQTADGKLAFQDTIENWPALIAPAAEEAAPAK